MIWGEEGAEDHKKKREKENTGLVGNCGAEWWEKERMGKTRRPDVRGMFWLLQRAERWVDAWVGGGGVKLNYAACRSLKSCQASSILLCISHHLLIILTSLPGLKVRTFTQVLYLNSIYICEFGLIIGLITMNVWTQGPKGPNWQSPTYFSATMSLKVQMH